MQDQCGRVFSSQKLKLKKLLSSKNKVFGMSKNISPNFFNLKIFATLFLSLAMSSKLDINIFGNFKVSSLLDTGIWRRAHAATSTTTTMKLKDLPIGGVINLGAYNYVKIADNQFMQTEVAACPDGKTVAGKYVKCFEDSSAYTQMCTGSNYCGNDSQWDGSASKCVGLGKCGHNAYTTDAVSNVCTCVPDYFADNNGANSTALGNSCKFTACASGKYADASGHQYTSTGSCTYVACGANATTTYGDGKCNCNSGYSWNSTIGACEEGTFVEMQNWTGCSQLATNATIELFDTLGRKTYTVKKFANGRCYTYDDLSTSSEWDDAKTLCSNIAGWSLPSREQFSNLVSKVGDTNILSVWCEDICTGDGWYSWWSTGVYGSCNPYGLMISKSKVMVYNCIMPNSARVRCIKD